VTVAGFLDRIISGAHPRSRLLSALLIISALAINRTVNTRLRG